MNNLSSLQTPPAIVPAPSKSKRSPNFNADEDEQLAKSWTLISKDAIISNNQTQDNFWTRVAEDFNKYTCGPKRGIGLLSIVSELYTDVVDWISLGTRLYQSS